MNPTDPTPGNSPADADKLAEALREAERLREQVAALTRERDEFKKLYLLELARNAPEVTQADLDAAIPLRPWLDDIIRELEAE